MPGQGAKKMPSQPGKFALVVGGSDTPAQPVDGLKGARLVARILRGYKYAVTSLLDTAATPTAFYAALDAIRLQMTPQSKLVIYYCGHGTGGSNQVCVYTELASALDTIPGVIAVTNDCCYSGAILVAAGPNRIVISSTTADHAEIAYPHQLTNFTDWFWNHAVSGGDAFEDALAYVNDLGLDSRMADQTPGGVFLP